MSLHTHSGLCSSSHLWNKTHEMILGASLQWFSPGLSQAVRTPCSSQALPAEDSFSHHTKFHPKTKRPGGERKAEYKENGNFKISKYLTRLAGLGAPHFCGGRGLSPSLPAGEIERLLGRLSGEDVLVTIESPALVLPRQGRPWKGISQHIGVEQNLSFCKYSPLGPASCL